MAFREIAILSEKCHNTERFGYPAVIMFYPIVPYSAFLSHLSPVILFIKVYLGRKKNTIECVASKYFYDYRLPYNKCDM